jgi:hypothetical protein
MDTNGGDDTKVSELSGSRAQNLDNLGVAREFVPIERLEDTRGGNLVVAPR